jgi:hypothetical protein
MLVPRQMRMYDNIFSSLSGTVLTVLNKYLSNFYCITLVTGKIVELNYRFVVKHCGLQVWIWIDCIFIAFKSSFL